MITLITNAAFIFWFAIVAVIAMAVLLEFEKEGWATTLFSLGSALIIWNYKESIFDFVTSKPGATFGFVGSYIAIGVIWSLLKWKSYITSKTNEFYKIKQDFIDQGGDIKNNWNKWVDFLEDKLNRSFYHDWNPDQLVAHVIPQANSKKSLITSWISYWPASLGATILNNPFRRFFEWIYSLVANIYDKIGNSATKDILNGLEKAEPSEPTNRKILRS